MGAILATKVKKMGIRFCQTKFGESSAECFLLNSPSCLPAGREVRRRPSPSLFEERGNPDSSGWGELFGNSSDEGFALGEILIEPTYQFRHGDCFFTPGATQNHT